MNIIPRRIIPKMVWSSYQTVFSFMNWCDIHSACSSIIRARYTFSFFLLLNDIIVAKQIIRPYMFTYLCLINTNHSENYLQKKRSFLKDYSHLFQVLLVQALSLAALQMTQVGYQRTSQIGRYQGQIYNCLMAA